MASKRVGCRIRNVACAVCRRESSERRVRVCIVHVSAERCAPEEEEEDEDEDENASRVSCRISLTGDESADAVFSSSWSMAHQSIDSWGL